MKKILILLLSILILYGIDSQNIITAKKAARIDNEIILQTDIEKYAKLYEVGLDQAKTDLINESILFYGAKVNSEPPTQEEIDKQVLNDRNYFASRLGRTASSLTDEEFLSKLKLNIYTMKSYREYVKRTLWINKYLKETIQKRKEVEYIPDSKEINNILEKKPEFFEEKEGALISMILFSYYDSNGKRKNDEQIKSLIAESEACLQELSKGEIFEKAVAKYSDDLISLNNVPKGRVGAVFYDDPRLLENIFSIEIINALKSSSEGLVNKVFAAKDGLFIFQIDEKLKSKKYSREESMLKAEAYLRKEYDNNLIKNVKTKLIEDLKKIIDLEIY